MSNPSRHIIDFGFLSVGSIDEHGWFKAYNQLYINSDEKRLYPSDIVIAVNTVIIHINGEYPEILSKTINSTDPKGFQRYELAEAVAKFFIENPQDEEDPAYATCNGVLDHILVDLTLNPPIVYASLDY